MSAVAAPASGVPGRASLADWLAIGAGTLGAMMAMMDISIVNASLPVIQGEIGATPSEGTWVGTSYLIAEVVCIPLTAWLERLFGLRRLLIGGGVLFTLFSIICGSSTSLLAMILGRAGQGLSGAVLIPSAMTLVATRLPPAQQTAGLAITAMSALLGPVVGPLLGGWLTENYSWHLAFYINVPLCMIQVTLLMIGLPKSQGDRNELRRADWIGVAGMVIGLGSITTLLEEGHREQWFDSALIWKLAIAGAAGIAMITFGQFRAKRPVIRIALLRNRVLASAVLLLVGLGMLLYSSLFIIPQFLVSIAGYNALQAGGIAFLGGVIAIPTAFIYPFTFARLDIRIVVGLAVLILTLTNYLVSGLSTGSTGSDFVIPQLIFGVGTTLTAIPLQSAVISSVRPEDASEANSLSSVARNLGGSISLAALASFQDQRFDLHHWRINSAMSANDAALGQQLNDTAATFGGGAQGLEAATRMIDGQVMVQAVVMSFNDVFLALAVAGLVVAPFALFLRTPQPGAAPMVMH